MFSPAGLYLNGWFPPVVLDGQAEWLYHFHVADETVRALGEWVWVGRAKVGDDAS